MNFRVLTAPALLPALLSPWAWSGAAAETRLCNAKPGIDLVGGAQLDYGAHTDDDMSSADDFSLRRLRLGVKGGIPNRAAFKFVADIDEDANISFTDVYVKRRLDSAGAEIVVGQHRTPNSLDEQTSSGNVPVLERAAFTDAFSLGRRLGVSLRRHRDSYSLSAGAFARDIDGEDARRGMAVAARIAYHPALENQARLHIGASVRYRALSEDEAPFQYSQRAFSRITDPVAEASTRARSDIFWGGEISFVRNGFWATSEYSALIAKPDDALQGADNELMHGGYMEAGVIIGGKRHYDKGRFHKPVIHRPITRGGPGALALTARFDTLDLGENDLGRADYNAVILGADWLPLETVRLGVNVFSTSGNTADLSGISALETSDRVNGVLLRGQVVF